MTKRTDNETFFLFLLAVSVVHWPEEEGQCCRPHKCRLECKQQIVQEAHCYSGIHGPRTAFCTPQYHPKIFRDKRQLRWWKIDGSISEIEKFKMMKLTAVTEVVKDFRPAVHAWASARVEKSLAWSLCVTSVYRDFNHSPTNLKA